VPSVTLPREAPFISKTLKLVSLAILLATIMLAVTAAYSGYEEYGALTSTAETSSLDQVSLALNGSTLTLSGLSVPNRMTFPLTLELLGNVSLDNTAIGNFDSGTYVIQPNQSQTISVSIPLSFQGLLKDSKALEAAVMNSTVLSINTTVSAHVVPLLGINITRSANTTAGPILGGFSANLNASGAALSPGGQTVNVPLVLSWENTSPVSSGAFWMSAKLTEIPGRPTGNYGSASGPLSFVEGQNQQTFSLILPVSDFSNGKIPHGTYAVQIAFSEPNSTSPFLEFTKSVSA
jgi:hypothetical protein